MTDPVPLWKKTFAGVGIRGYRSFGGAELQYIGPLEKVHLLAGQNNTGKSNALRVIKDILPTFGPGSVAPITLYPDPRAWPDQWDREAPMRMTLGFYRNEDFLDALFPTKIYSALDELFRDEVFHRGMPGTVWLDFDAIFSPTQGMYSWRLVEESLVGIMHRQLPPGLDYEVNAALDAVFIGSSSRVFDNLVGVLSQLDFTQFVPPVVAVHAARHVTASTATSTRTATPEQQFSIEWQAANGDGLIGGIARLRNPDDADIERDRPRFRAIVRFIRDILEDQHADLTTNQNATELLVETRGIPRKIENLGSGIEQVVLMAVAATVAQNSLLVIEEPELYLHPTLQRKLLAYLADHTTNHYVASTHSAHILNATKASIGHVEAPGAFSQINGVLLPSRQASLVSDLGYRASDLVQSNFIVWVEGPSDRTYIRQWVEEADPRLVEGAHYSIMFYGGGLLSHLAFDDPEITDFIDMNRLNRNLSIVIDSDIGPTSSSINETKSRVLRELEAANGWGWVTDGYTIENYVHPGLLREAVSGVYVGKGLKSSQRKNISPLKKGSVTDLKGAPSKTLIAKKVVELAPSFRARTQSSPWLFDVSEKSRLLAEQIARANDLPSA